jgi:ArsR family transcriptional regulator
VLGGVDGMEQIYIDTAKVLKAISDPKRLRIVDMLSCGELCACRILEAFHITQPTLSHDMRVLIEAKIVNDRREGKNIYYSLNKEYLQRIEQTLQGIFTEKSDCICHSGNCNN